MVGKKKHGSSEPMCAMMGIEKSRPSLPSVKPPCLCFAFTLPISQTLCGWCLRTHSPHTQPPGVFGDREMRNGPAGDIAVGLECHLPRSRPLGHSFRSGGGGGWGNKDPDVEVRGWLHTCIWRTRYLYSVPGAPISSTCDIFKPSRACRLPPPRCRSVQPPTGEPALLLFSLFDNEPTNGRRPDLHTTHGPL
jgi:hypothetical protein